jgi:hypothetical protein
LVGAALNNGGAPPLKAVFQSQSTEPSLYVVAIAPELKEFAESSVAVTVGVNHPAHGPRLASGWGFRIHPESSRAEVFVDVRSSGQVVEALRTDGRIAVVLADPVSYRSVQFKGRVLDLGEPSPLDRAWVARTRELFTAGVALIGEAPAVSRNGWTEEVTRVAFSVAEVFDQTPGLNAGRRLS